MALGWGSAPLNARPWEWKIWFGPSELAFGYNWSDVPEIKTWYVHYENECQATWPGGVTWQPHTGAVWSLSMRFTLCSAWGHRGRSRRLRHHVQHPDRQTDGHTKVCLPTTPVSWSLCSERDWARWRLIPSVIPKYPIVSRNVHLIQLHLRPIRRSRCASFFSRASNGQWNLHSRAQEKKRHLGVLNDLM